LGAPVSHLSPQIFCLLFVKPLWQWGKPGKSLGQNECLNVGLTDDSQDRTPWLGDRQKLKESPLSRLQPPGSPLTCSHVPGVSPCVVVGAGHHLRGFTGAASTHAQRACTE